MLVFNDVSKAFRGTISTYNMSLSIANVYGISYATKHTKKQKPGHIQSRILSDMNSIYKKYYLAILEYIFIFTLRIL